MITEINRLEIKKLHATRGNRLRLWRARNGLTRVFVANALKISETTIYYWERGRIGIPNHQLKNLIEMGFPKEDAYLEDIQIGGEHV